MMNAKWLPIAATAALLGAGAPQYSSAEGYMLVKTWDPGCEHTMETNHFDLAPGTAVEIEIDLAGCTEQQRGMLLFYGYVPKRNSSEGLNQRHGVRLEVTDISTGQVISSDEGHVLAAADSSGRYRLVAENTNARKPITLRLVSRSGL
jgi:hypothetical protein